MSTGKDSLKLDMPSAINTVDPWTAGYAAARVKAAAEIAWCRLDRARLRKRECKLEGRELPEYELKDESRYLTEWYALDMLHTVLDREYDEATTRYEKHLEDVMADGPMVPDEVRMPMSHEDGDPFCECEACAALVEKYDKTAPST